MKAVKLEDRLYKKAKKMSLVQRTNVDEVIAQALNHGLDALSEKNVMELYRSRKVTLQKAAEMLSVDMWEMIEKIKNADIHIDYTPEELKEDTA